MPTGAGLAPLRPGLASADRLDGAPDRLIARRIGCEVGLSPPTLRIVIGTEFGNILNRAHGGDPSAFACMWYDINPTLRRYLSVIAGEVHEDVVTQTWLIVGRGVARFQGDEMAWRSWVFATARRAEPAAFEHQPLVVRGTAEP